MTDKEKVKKAVLKGNVTASARAQKALATMDFNDPNPDFTITEIDLNCWGPFKLYGVQINYGGFDITYETKSAGRGRVTIYNANDGKLRCERQGMSQQFIKDLLARLVDELILD